LHALAAHRRGTHGDLTLLTAPELPSVTIIVPAHNEATVIAAKIKNLAALNYPRQKLHIELALDGCSDATAAVAKTTIGQLEPGATWQLVEYERNRGKVAVLNDRIGQASSDIIALSDASAMLNSDALIEAARHFADPALGVVCGTYRLARPGSEGERAYWEYQARVKADEAALVAPMGAHGAFYLFRRLLWSPVPEDTINDDFIIPMEIVVQGYKAGYNLSIVATELERSPTRLNFYRRVRIGAGNLQQVIRLARLGDPRRRELAFLFLSGKALRALMPFVFVAASVAVVSLAVNGVALYRWILGIEIIGLVVAAVAMQFPSSKLPRPLSWLSYFVSGYAAALVGSILLLAGYERHVWKISAASKSRLVGASDT
jgi:glycosyltransferase involved in cell wall biosynthesis